MGLGKLILALIFVVAVGVLVYDIRRARKEEKANEDLYKDLDDANAQLRKADVEDDVLDAKLELQKRRQKLDRKAEKLAPTDEE